MFKLNSIVRTTGGNLVKIDSLMPGDIYWVTEYEYYLVATFPKRLYELRKDNLLPLTEFERLLLE